jgi:hypothetical protein
VLGGYPENCAFQQHGLPMFLMRTGQTQMALLLLRVQRSNVKTARRRYARESSGQVGYTISKEVVVNNIRSLKGRKNIQ